ncbi:MAG TPA: biotin/lipoyl-containing protein, partial [Streptosporangiaceae bacterium]|nr:biotin/lipoyl-containing protein [Streptosporangiaceae bacterium]
MTVTVSMPQLGESVTEGTVTRWLKKEGERVEADEPLLEVSTDKVDTEIPSPASGILRGITVAEDETVAVGAPLAIIDDADGAGAATDGQAQAADAATLPAPSQAPPGGPEPGGYPYAVPEQAPAPQEYAQPAPAYQAPAEPQYRPAVPEYSAPYSQAPDPEYAAPAAAGYAAPPAEGYAPQQAYAPPAP